MLRKPGNCTKQMSPTKYSDLNTKNVQKPYIRFSEQTFKTWSSNTNDGKIPRGSSN